MGEIRIIITSPSGRSVEAVIEQTDNGFRVRFTPAEIGDYSIEIYWGDAFVPESPFRVTSIPEPALPAMHYGSEEMMDEPYFHQELVEDLNNNHREEDRLNCTGEYISCEQNTACLAPERVRAYGEGLVRGFQNAPAYFVIDTRGAGRGDIDVTVEGASEANIECSDNGDGTCTVAYFPTLPGRYLVNILFALCHIPGSPFSVDILPLSCVYDEHCAVEPGSMLAPNV